MQRFIVADSGSSKTDWIHVQDEQEFIYHCKGLNPNQCSESHLLDELSGMPWEIWGDVPLFFYGSGCSRKEKQQYMLGLIQNYSQCRKIRIEGDVLGACIACCADKEGIVIILGTGTAVCQYNGQEIIQLVPSTGYLTGDEASGAAFGRTLVLLATQHELPRDLQKEFDKRFETDLIYEKLKHSQTPAAFLASFFRFEIEFRSHPSMQELIRNQLLDLINKQISVIQAPAGSYLHFCGSVAFLLQDEIQLILEEQGFHAGRFVRQPLSALVNFHRAQKEMSS